MLIRPCPHLTQCGTFMYMYTVHVHVLVHYMLHCTCTCICICMIFVRECVYMQASKVTLTDCKSKFGSSVNGKKLSANQKVDLFVNNELKFGQGPMTGTFKYAVVIVVVFLW